MRRLSAKEKVAFKRSCWLVLKNPWNLSDDQKERLSTLVQWNTPIVRGYLIEVNTQLLRFITSIPLPLSRNNFSISICSFRLASLLDDDNSGGDEQRCYKFGPSHFFPIDQSPCGKIAAVTDTLMDALHGAGAV